MNLVVSARLVVIVLMGFLVLVAVVGDDFVIVLVVGDGFSCSGRCCWC